MLNSYARCSPQQNRNLNESRNTTNILPPHITSTPCSSSNKARISSPLVTPRRFLGPRRYALSSNGTLSPLKTMKDPPGPLLTSTSYNVNVSTYIDSKSPGYTGRLVQYNEENSRNQQHTHQEKYGSPGLLPIVHLFKKEVPVIKPKPKQVTVRIGTPELKNQYSQEHNRLLLEGFVRGNSVIKENSPSSNEVSTRSVLDALKEISRKRIHASEEYEVMDETNKKLRRDCVSGEGDCSKRNRVDSPTSDASTSPLAKQAPKKLCTIDAILASKTSSMYANYDTSKKRKPIEDIKTKVSPISKKKFNNAETQTLYTSKPREENKHFVETNDGFLNQAKTGQNPTENSFILEETTSPPKQVLKIFDDKPLEIIRKNRLGALLSALTGHEIPPIPMEDRKKALDQDWPPQKSEKALVSILSSPDKQPKTVEKHVTFNIPENSTDSSSSLNLPESINKNSEKQFKTETPLQKRTTESQGLIKDADNLKDISNNQKSLSVTQKSVDDNIVGDTHAPSSMGGFKFDSTRASVAVSASMPVGGFKFDFSKPGTLVKDVANKDNNSGSFQLNSTTCAPSTTKTEDTTVNFTSPTAATSSSIGSPSLLPKFGVSSTELITSAQLPSKSSLDTNNHTKSISTSTKTNSLGLPSVLPESVTQSSFGIGTSIASFIFSSGQSTPSASASSSFVKSDHTFGKKDVSSKPSNTCKSNLSVSTIAPTSTNSTTATDVNRISAYVLRTPPKTISSNASPYSSPALGCSSTTSTTNPNVLNSITAQYSLAASSVSSPLGVFTKTAAFGSSPSKINFPTTTSVSPHRSTPGVISNSNFGTVNTCSNGFSYTSGNSLPAFGTTSATSSVGPSSCVAPTFTFGDASLNFGDLKANTSFGTTKTNLFGSMPTNNMSLSSPSNTQPMFAMTTTTPSFGITTANNVGTESKAFVFGSGNSQTFGHPLTSGTTSTVLTLKNSQSGMTIGTNTSASTASNTQLGSTSSAFGGAGNMFSSAGSSNFGQSTSVSSFGTTISPAFATTTTTTPFGTTATPTFGTTSSASFGTTCTPAFETISTPTFSTSAPAFSTTSVPVFGTTNAPSFGTTITPAFGTTSVTSFGTTIANSFGTTSPPSFNIAPSFDATTTAPTFGISNSLNFGAPNMTSSTFGNTSTSNFASPSTTKSLFGTSNTLSFGNTKTTASGFGTSNTLTFGVPSTTSTTFGTNTPSFCVPTTSPVFGTTNTPSFGGSTTAPAFGTTTTSSFASCGTFNPPSFGVSSPFGTTQTTSANTFNSSNTNSPFGNSAGTNSFNTFGPTNPPFNPVTTALSFGSNNTFGSSNTSATFGINTTNNAFGNTNAASPFGGSGGSTTFGNNNAVGSSAFGSGFGPTAVKPEQSNMFPTQNNNMFGNNTAFGPTQSNSTGNPGASSTGGVFTFGSPNTQSSLSNGVFAFGAAEPPKTFNFSAPGTSGNGPSSSAFPTANAFGQPSSSTPSMFSIGSGSSTTQNRSRAMARAKRRT